MTTFEFADGAYNNAQGTRDAFGGLSDRLVSEGLPAMRSISGDREHADQVRIFVSRYVQQASGSGRYGDVRWWNGSADGYPGGTRWVRISGAGTVAVPGSGNHEARRSNDLTWPYNAATPAHARARDLAGDYGITCEGINFDEWWHWTYWGPLGTIGAAASSGGAQFKPKEWDEMATKEEIRAVIDDALKGRSDGPLAVKVADREGLTHLAILDRGLLRHLVAGDNPDYVRNVLRASDDWLETTVEDQKFEVLLRSRGVDIDPPVYRIVPAVARPGTTMEVFDPLTETWGEGHVWTAENAIRAELGRASSNSRTFG